MDNNNEIINVEALILSTNKKRCKKFIDYLNMKNTDEENDESGNSLSIFSFQNHNMLEIKDDKNNKIYRVNFSKEFCEDKFYHCFIIIYDCCDQTSYDKATETFFPLIQSITSKLDFDFVLLMIGEYNENHKDKKEKVVQMEVSQNFAINNGFFLLEMNFSKKTNMDLINKVLKIRLNQSYMQFPEYYDKSRQTERHILNALKAFEFNYESEEKEGKENVVVIGNLFSENSRDREEFLTFEENIIDDKCDLETCLNSDVAVKKNVIKNNSVKTTNDAFERHSFFKDLFSAKTSNPTKIDSKNRFNTNANTQSNISITNPNNNSIQTKNSNSSSKQGHRRTYSENNKTKFTSAPKSSAFALTDKLLSTNGSTSDSLKSTQGNDVLLILKIQYKASVVNLNVASKDTSEEIAQAINTHFGLKLEMSGIYSLAKTITKKINKFIRVMSNKLACSKNIDLDNYTYLAINLNKVLNKKRIKVAVTVNNQKLNFYFAYNPSMKGMYSGKIDDVVEEAIKSLDKEYEYDITSLRQSLKSAVISSIKNTLNVSVKVSTH